MMVREEEGVKVSNPNRVYFHTDDAIPFVKL